MVVGRGSLVMGASSRYISVDMWDKKISELIDATILYIKPSLRTYGCKLIHVKFVQLNNKIIE